MGKEDRKRAILRFLHECDLMLPPKVLHKNMKRKGATFSETTVNRHLAELLDEGFVEKPLESEGYYAISDKGRQYLAGDEVED